MEIVENFFSGFACVMVEVFLVVILTLVDCLVVCGSTVPTTVV